MRLLVLIALRQGWISEDRLLTRVSNYCRGPKQWILSGFPLTSGFVCSWWANSACPSWRGWRPAAEIPELTAASLGHAGAGLGAEAPKGPDAPWVGPTPPPLLAFRGKAVRGGDSGPELAFSWVTP